MERQRMMLVAQLSRRLQQDGWPRLQMLLLVGLTGGAGFLASFLLLRAGLGSMSERYPLAVLIAYGVFLLLLWAWLRSSLEDWLDLPDVDLGGGSSQCRGTAGDGALDGMSDGLPDLNVLDGADELAIPLIVLLAVVGLLLASLWVVYAAPALFAELLLDAVLSATLYRGLKRLERRHWLRAAVRRTWLPFLLTAVLASGCGAWLQQHTPGAVSLGEALQGPMDANPSR